MRGLPSVSELVDQQLSDGVRAQRRTAAPGVGDRVVEALPQVNQDGATWTRRGERAATEPDEVRESDAAVEIGLRRSIPRRRGGREDQVGEGPFVMPQDALLNKRGGDGRADEEGRVRDSRAEHVGRARDHDDTDHARQDTLLDIEEISRLASKDDGDASGAERRAEREDLSEEARDVTRGTQEVGV